MANSELDSTISALNGGITTLSPSVAVSNIEGWESQLHSSGKPELTSIATDLGALRQQLTSGKLDGSAIGQLLSKLGKETTSVAGGAEAASKDKLTTLGSLLTKAGSALGGHA